MKGPPCRENKRSLNETGTKSAVEAEFGRGKESREEGKASVVSHATLICPLSVLSCPVHSTKVNERQQEKKDICKVRARQRQSYVMWHTKCSMQCMQCTCLNFK